MSIQDALCLAMHRPLVLKCHNEFPIDFRCRPHHAGILSHGFVSPLFRPFSFCLLFVASPITIFSPRISSLPLSSSAGLCRSKRSLFYGSFSSAWNFVPGRATGLAIRASKCNKGCVYYTISPIIPKSNPKCQAMCRQSGEPMRTYKILIRITISWPLRTKLNISQ